jgi:hypothetical protein
MQRRLVKLDGSKYCPLKGGANFLLCQGKFSRSFSLPLCMMTRAHLARVCCFSKSLSRFELVT